MVPPQSSTGLPVGPSLAVSVDVPRARVSVAGELDRESAHHLLDALTVLTAQPGRRWRLDAAGVTFCDAGGVRALSRAHELATAHGRTLQLERSSRPVERLVELVGHDRVFPAGEPSPTGGPAVPPGTATARRPPRTGGRALRPRGCGVSGVAQPATRDRRDPP